MRRRARPGRAFEELAGIMARLRGPHGCPWDRRQTHRSLLPYLFSEARELKAAVAKSDWRNCEEELGDVLLQVVFHSQLAAESGRFTLTDVVRGISRKLKRRHPHVFGGPKLHSPAAVVRQWKEIKKREKARKQRPTHRRTK